MSAYDGNGQWHEWRTSRRERPCHQRVTDTCTRLVLPGERYVKSVLAPYGDIGNVGWWNHVMCGPCAAHYRLANPKAVATQ